VISFNTVLFTPLVGDLISLDINLPHFLSNTPIVCYYNLFTLESSVCINMILVLVIRFFAQFDRLTNFPDCIQILI
jgi:hypothetical protein